MGAILDACPNILTGGKFSLGRACASNGIGQEIFGSLQDKKEIFCPILGGLRRNIVTKSVGHWMLLGC